jgi:ubiquinone/menaquinone biosynthesis C-methylase UbiE
MREAWEANAQDWIAWSRAPGHDSYWRFHRDAFLPLVPLPGRLTLDIGCGEGRVSRDLAHLGHRVIGIDGSPAMSKAAATHSNSGGSIAVGDASVLPLPDGIADCAVAFMSLLDVDEMELAVAEVARVLSPGSRFVIAITHPLNTAGRFIPGPDEGSRPFVVEGSWFDRKALADTCERDGFTMTFHTEHRPLQAYIDALADAGFVVQRIREVTEPNPADKWSRIPLFLHVLAIRS